MARMKLVKPGKKKPPPPKGGAFGCAFVIILLLALFIWAFSGALRQ